MHRFLNRISLAGVIGATLLTSACVSTDDLMRVEGIANQALAASQQAQTTANAAGQRADQANQTAQNAVDTAQQAQATANAAQQEANRAHEEVLRQAQAPRRARFARGERG